METYFVELPRKQVADILANTQRGIVYNQRSELGNIRVGDRLTLISDIRHQAVDRIVTHIMEHEGNDYLSLRPLTGVEKASLK